MKLDRDLIARHLAHSEEDMVRMKEWRESEIDPRNHQTFDRFILRAEKQVAKWRDAMERFDDGRSPSIKEIVKSMEADRLNCMRELRDLERMPQSGSA